MNYGNINGQHKLLLYEQPLINLSPVGNPIRISSAGPAGIATTALNVPPGQFCMWQF